MRRFRIFVALSCIVLGAFLLFQSDQDGSNETDQSSPNAETASPDSATAKPENREPKNRESEKQRRR